MNRKRVLVAPLDWGLGHATRCVPIIRSILAQKITPILAGSGMSIQWLSQQFPQLEVVELPDYKIRYSSIFPMSLQMLRLAPNVLKTIRKEQQAVAQLIPRYGISGIISDHRYGVFSPQVPSVFVSHQLVPHAGRLSFLQPFIQKWHRSLIRPFREIWIPDEPEPHSISGSLSGHHHLSIPVHFIGWLSAHEVKPGSQRKGVSFILSGVEPQRSQLEQLFIPIAQQLPTPVHIIRGSETPHPHSLAPHINSINVANARQMGTLLQTSALIVGRCGYSSIMDAVLHQTPALFIPTPGQTEQEYLAHYNASRLPFLFIQQRDLTVAHLHQALASATHTAPYTNQRLEQVVQKWASSL